jgi:mono/diheme cytochrome c family protein
MKIYALFLSLIVLGMCLSSSVYSQDKPATPPDTAQALSSAIPAELGLIFKNSCLQCHSSASNGMAKAKLNFSEWDSYNSEKQADKAAASCKEVNLGAMPPKRFVESNPAAALTDAQREMICNWSTALAAKK